MDNEQEEGLLHLEEAHCIRIGNINRYALSRRLHVTFGLGSCHRGDSANGTRDVSWSWNPLPAPSRSTVPNGCAADRGLAGKPYREGPERRGSGEHVPR